ncbi:alpha/beta hydrolase [Bdellovibrio sp. HCB274]|uniref:alpha/beta hydrolase n=1 Tax=Bdellovibrio sp. HCB274 TaxID=3394361 RepID=UPI0039B6C761
MSYQLVLVLLLTSFISLSTFAGECPALFPGSDSRAEWRLSNRQPSRAVAVVVHGLNINPGKMRTIENALLADRIDVLHVSLSGHNNNINIFRRVSAKMWERDTLRAYCLASQRADKYNMPIYYVGFSLGGVMGVAIANKYENVHFDKMALFAPALSIRRANFLTRLLNSLNPLALIPNVMNRDYYASALGTPVSAYKATLDVSAYLAHHTNRNRVNTSTLLFYDKRDELISPTGTFAYMREHRLTNWKTYQVQKRPFSRASMFHHIMIDPASVGQKKWADMKSALLKHFDE